MRALYEYPPTRSQRARWALEELGVDYESRVVDLPARAQDEAGYRAIHPLGVVPALGTDGYTMIIEANEGGVVWVPSNLDLTDVLIQRYNKQAKSGGGGAKKSK